MRVVPLLVTTLLLAAPVFAQQTAVTQHAKAAAPSEAVAQTVDQLPLHPITPQQVHEILELTGANRLKEQMMRSMWVSLQKSFPPFFPKDVLDDLEANMLKIDFEPMAVKAYQKHISAEDAELIIAFDKTQAGKRLIAVMPLIQQEMLTGGYKAGVRVAQEVIARHADEIKAAAAKYRAEHSDAPKIIEPN